MKGRALKQTILAAAGFLGVLAVAEQANAQANTFELDRLRMGGAPDDGIGVWRPELADRPRFFGQAALGLSWNPFRIEHHLEDPAERAEMSAVSGAPVREQFTGYFDVGFEIFQRFSFQILFPVTFVQTGNPTSAAGVASATDAVDLAIAAPGDMRFEGRGVLFRTADGFFKLGANVNLFAPSGNSLSFTGDKSAHGGVGVAAELDWKSFILTFDTGFHFRPEAHVNDFDVGHEWTYGLAGFLPLRDDRIRLGVEVFGSAMMTREDAGKVATSPIEWAAEGRFILDEKKQLYLNGFGGSRLSPGYAPDFRTGIAFGGWFNIIDVEPPSPTKNPRFDAPNDNVDTDKDGFPDNIDLCPTEPEDGKPPYTTDGCPKAPDRDEDGIPDSKDKCPDVKEDFDGVDDKDGCPEDDADSDGVPDATDKCPKVPGEKSAEKDKNGCPKFIRVIEGGTTVEILKKVEFEFGSSKLSMASYPILDEIYRYLVANPEVQRLSIEGHTDNVGSEAGNLLLSKGRAKSCMDYLLQKGIASKRLTSEGFGEERPIETNDTPAGRAANRRTEFHIKDQASPGGEPTPPKPTGPVPGEN